VASFYVKLESTIDRFQQSASFKKAVIECAEVQSSQTIAVFPQLTRAFTYIAKGGIVERDVSEAVAISVPVRERLSGDVVACTFLLGHVPGLHSFQCIVAGWVLSDGQSLSTLGRQLCKSVPGLQSVC
jgi:hypothetical protein